MSKTLFVCLILVLSFVSVNVATNFSSCQTFLSPDTYDLTSNIQINGSSCLTVSTGLLPASPTTIDCHGYEIIGNYSANKYGIIVQDADDITIKNCVFREFGSAMAFNSGSNAIIQNNTFDNSTASGILFGASNGLVSNITFTNNTVSNNWNNGIEIYNMSYGNFSDNVLFGHEHGHGTDRTGQFVYNVVYTNWTNNYMYNNTICFRNDGTNVSNVIIANNICENNTGTGFLTFSGSSSGAGRYGNITIANNSVSSLYNSSGFDFGWGASVTTQDDCANWFVENNTVTGGAYLMLNSSNSSTSISNLNVGGMIICNADNINLTNITITGGSAGRNGIELMHVNNLVFDTYQATNTYSALRGLIVNDSVFTNHNYNGGGIGAVNFAGGTSSRNNLSFFNISNVTSNTAIFLGGANNTASNFFIYNSSTIGSSVGFSTSTATMGNTYSDFIIENTLVGIAITNLGSGNKIKNFQMRNVSTALLVNSTASGTKTFTLNNITLTNSGGLNPTIFSLDDSVAPSEQYTIKLAQFAPSPPSGNLSFNNATLNITTINGTLNFTSFNMSWPEYLTAIYDENTISLYQHNNTDWILLNNTPDTTNNVISYTSPVLTSGKSNLFGLLSTALNCPVLNISGVYSSPSDYTGAPNTDSYLQNACIVINASNTKFDCDEHNVDANGSGGTGVSITSGLSNITIINCNIGNYSNGIYIQNGYYDLITNNSFTTNSEGVVFGFGSTYNNITNNLFTSNNVRAINLGNANYNLFDHNNFTNENIAISFLSSSHNNVSANLFGSASYQTLQLANSAENRITDNSFVDYSPTQIDLQNIENLTIQSNTFTYFDTAINACGLENALIDNNTASLGSGVINIVCPGINYNITISNNSFTDIGGSDMHIEGNKIFVSDNHLTSEGEHITGVYVNNSIFNNNTDAIISIQHIENSAIENTTYNQASNVIILSYAVNITIRNITIADLVSGNAISFDENSHDILVEDSSAGQITSHGNGPIFLSASGASNITLRNSYFENITLAFLNDGSILGFDALNNHVDNITVVNSNLDNVTFGFEPKVSGVAFYFATNGSVTNSHFYNNQEETAFIILASDPVLSENNTFANNNYALVCSNGCRNLTSKNDHFYNNTQSFFVNTSNSSVVTIHSIFDNPLGNFVNYSNISLTDIIDTDSLSLSSWAINYAENTDPSSTGNLSLNNASINITNLDNMSINQIVWTYSPGALNSTQQNSIKVWEYNGSWARMPSGVNLVTYLVTLNTVTTSGEYTLLYDINGTPISSGDNLIVPEASLAFGVVAYMYYRSQRGGYVRVFILFGWL